MTSIRVDWSEDYENWTNHGRRVLEENCNHKGSGELQDNEDDDSENADNNIRNDGYCEECEFYEDTAEPMMNYAYPLETTPSDDRILEVVKRTNCTIMENKEGEYFLALCGGGMDLSQDIALAYILAEKWIPMDLLCRVNKQPELSVGGKDWELLKEEIIFQSKAQERTFAMLREGWSKKKR